MTCFMMKTKTQGNKRIGEISLYEEISALWGTAQLFASQLKALGEVDEIHLYINSIGGDTNQGFAIYNQLKRHPARKVATIDGIAASMASVVAMAADEVVMPSNAFIMVHNPWAMVAGDAEDFGQASQLLGVIRDQAVKAYADKTGLDEATLLGLLEGPTGKGTYLTAEEAKGYGFADTILPEVKAVALATHAQTLAATQGQANLPTQLQAVLPTPEPAPTAGLAPQEPPAPMTTPTPTYASLEAFKADAPDLYAKLRAEAATQAIAAEHERLKAIEAVALAGYDDLVTQAKADPTQTADTLAIAIVARQKANASNVLLQMANNAPPPAPTATSPQGQMGIAQRPNTFATLKERAEWEFANDPTIQAQGFADADTYFYALKAEGAKA